MEETGRFRNCFIYLDHNSYTYLYIGKRGRKLLHHFIAVDHEGQPSVKVLKKDDKFFDTLRAAIFVAPKCLYYTDLKLSARKFLTLYDYMTWTAEAKNLIYEVLGRRVLSVSFTEEGGRVGRRGMASKKQENPNVPLATICEGLKLDAMEVRKWLRESDIKKPGGRWEWPPSDVPTITKKIKEFFRA